MFWHLRKMIIHIVTVQFFELNIPTSEKTDSPKILQCNFFCWLKICSRFHTYFHFNSFPLVSARLWQIFSCFAALQPVKNIANETPKRLLIENYITPIVDGFIFTALHVSCIVWLNVNCSCFRFRTARSPLIRIMIAEFKTSSNLKNQYVWQFTSDRTKYINVTVKKS